MIYISWAYQKIIQMPTKTQGKTQTIGTSIERKQKILLHRRGIQNTIYHEVKGDLPEGFILTPTGRTLYGINIYVIQIGPTFITKTLLHVMCKIQ